MLSSVVTGTSTFTRDLPYGWDTLVENIVDPSHIPFAHHGLQGTREDAIPINLTVTSEGQHGFEFDFADRTMGRRRAGSGSFKAPYIVAYQAEYGPKQTATAKQLAKEASKPPKTFNLTVVCLPTRPGWSRIIIFVTLPKGFVFAALPAWLLHLFPNRFLDSDLAFLHFQEQTAQERGYAPNNPKYFMPAQVDRGITALRNWIGRHATVLRPRCLRPCMSGSSSCRGGSSTRRTV